MKKTVNIGLSLLLLLSLAACGGGGKQPSQPAPDLNQYYADFMASLPEDEQPMMMDLEGDLVSQYYPGLEGCGAKQQVLKAAAITMAAFEFALVELDDASQVQTVADIFQARIDAQVAGGAFYPMSIEAWGKAQVITHGNVVALISAGDSQEAAVNAFNALFA